MSWHTIQEELVSEEEGLGVLVTLVFHRKPVICGTDGKGKRSTISIAWLASGNFPVCKRKYSTVLVIVFMKDEFRQEQAK